MQRCNDATMVATRYHNYLHFFRFSFSSSEDLSDSDRICGLQPHLPQDKPPSVWVGDKASFSRDARAPPNNKRVPTCSFQRRF